MSRFEQLDPKSQKIHRNWSRMKHAKAQVNGETEITLHNRLLRSEAMLDSFNHAKAISVITGERFN